MRHRHEDLHHLELHEVEVAAADRVLEQRVPGEHERLVRAVVHDEADHVGGMARASGSRSIVEVACRQRARHDRQPELGLVRDVVGVGVGAEDVRRGQVVRPARTPGAARAARRSRRTRRFRRPCRRRGRRWKASRGRGSVRRARPKRYIARDRLRLSAISTGGRHARPVGAHDDDHQGEVLEASQQGREPRRDARLQLRGAAAPAPEREARDRRRHDREEAPRDPVHLDAAAGREARRPGEGGDAGEPRGPRPAGADQEGGDPGPARRHHDPGPAARGSAAEADRGLAAALGEDRAVPQPEGGHQGAVLGRRGPGADRRGGDRDLQPRCPTSAPRSSVRRTRPSTCRPVPTRSTSSPRRAHSTTSPPRATRSTASSRRSSSRARSTTSSRR